MNPARTRVFGFQDGGDRIQIADTTVDASWISSNVSDLSTGAHILAGVDSTIDLVSVYSASLTTADFV